MDSPGQGPVMTVLRTGGGEPPAPEPAPPKRRWRAPGPGLGRKILIAVVVIWAVAITAVVLTRGGNTPAPTAARPSVAPSASDAPLTVEIGRASCRERVSPRV